MLRNLVWWAFAAVGRDGEGREENPVRSVSGRWQRPAVCTEWGVWDRRCGRLHCALLVVRRWRDARCGWPYPHPSLRDTFSGGRRAWRVADARTSQRRAAVRLRAGYASQRDSRCFARYAVMGTTDLHCGNAARRASLQVIHLDTEAAASRRTTHNAQRTTHDARRLDGTHCTHHANGLRPLTPAPTRAKRVALQRDRSRLAVRSHPAQPLARWRPRPPTPRPLRPTAAPMSAAGCRAMWVA